MLLGEHLALQHHGNVSDLDPGYDNTLTYLAERVYSSVPCPSVSAMFF